MPDQTTAEPTATEELRLQALDRAINYFYGRDADPNTVVETATRFETYLRGA